MQEEIWKPIPNYPKYEVSTYGRVASLDYMHTGKRVIMSLVNLIRGYKGVKLYNKDGMVLWKVHRLVAITFLPNPNNLPLVNHKDENTSNNHVDNLEWCTHQCNCTYNNSHIKKGLKIRGEKNGMYGKHLSDEHKNKMSLKLKGKPKSESFKRKLREIKSRGFRINQYDLEGNFIEQFVSSTEASEKTGVGDSFIRACCRGKYKQAGGYRWERVKIEKV